MLKLMRVRQMVSFKKIGVVFLCGAFALLLQISSIGATSASAASPPMHSSLNSNSRAIASSTHGGGCNSSSGISSCISENSSRNIAPDGYVYVGCADVIIVLYEDGNQIGQTNYSCNGSQQHFVGPNVHPIASHTWQTGVWVDYPEGFHAFVPSPFQYT